MLTAMLSVENIVGAQHDVWAVNVEAEYLEQDDSGEKKSSTGRDAPVLPRRALDAAAAAAGRRFKGGCLRRRVSPRTYRMLVRSGPTIRVWRDFAPLV